ncbi:hypothetical protein AAG570_009594 [Ranatra chinensis]|uniref:Uncharacterized protein n=1 Tax=Ranatra chinensis TaxID=642074 RepID=A0ABD0YRP5_9HEMI
MLMRRRAVLVKLGVAGATAWLTVMLLLVTEQRGRPDEPADLQQQQLYQQQQAHRHNQQEQQPQQQAPRRHYLMNPTEEQPQPQSNVLSHVAQPVTMDQHRAVLPPPGNSELYGEMG